MATSKFMAQALATQVEQRSRVLPAVGLRTAEWGVGCVTAIKILTDPCWTATFPPYRLTRHISY
jgi:hypothetical protein